MFVESDIKVSFTILTHNEDVSLKRLINQLLSVKSMWDEIVIVDDYSDNLETIKILSWAEDVGCVVKRNQLNRDFSQQKNFVNSHCKNEYIFNIDADEYLDPHLIKNFKEILFINKDVEVFKLPRINTVSNITLEHIANWKWNIKKMDTLVEEKKLSKDSDEYKFYKAYQLVIDEKDDTIKYFVPVINFPDYQYRIYKNKPSIKWVGKVHEIVTGYNTYAHFPAMPEFCILHHKDIIKQEQQNKFYSEL